MTCKLKPREQARHLWYLTTPGVWNTWPHLPLVRRKEGTLELGVLCDLWGLWEIPGYSATVFLGNLFLLPGRVEELLALPQEVYDQPQEILDAGWRID